MTRSRAPVALALTAPLLALAALPAGAQAPGAPASREVLEGHLRRLFDGGDRLPGLKLRALTLGETRVTIGVEVPNTVRLEDLPPEVENRFESAIGLLDTLRPGLRGFDLMVAYPGQPLQAPPRYRLPAGARPPRRQLVLPDPSRFPDGQALAGKVVAISPGHGYIYYDSLAGYSTQRGRVSWTGCSGCRGIVEDFETYEIVMEHLVPLLEGAGAQVVLVRERDTTATGVIVDDGAAGYRELAGAFTAGPTTDAQGRTSRRSSAADAVAEWVLTPAASGPQLLSLWFVADAAAAQRARLEVLGPFGTHTLTLDQRSHGRRWTPLGVFDLEPSTPVTVRLSSSGEGAPITFDAARLGSGRHTSNHRWWEMGADTFAEREGAPSAVTAQGDVTTRPAYAEWQGADAYLALHSNAAGVANSTAVGTSSYRYSCGTFDDHAADPPAAQCDDPVGSDRLQDAVHRKLIEQLRADWDPNWRDRGTRVANFGEVRGLEDMPGVLVESAFHDNVVLAAGSNLRMTENQALHDPRWRRAAALGMYKGLTEFLVGAAAPIVLSPPEALVARRVDSTTVELSFGVVPGATRYRVYVAQASRSFDQGTLTAQPTLRLSGLTPEVPVAITVASLNAAGEGLRSKVVVARPSARRAQLLVVDAFEREDAWVQGIDNQRNTAHVQARALAGVPHAFDGATEAAWADGSVTLAGYEGLVLALGRESTEHEVLTPALRNDVAAFVMGGGAVFASGSEIGWTLDGRGDAQTRSFLDAVFGVALASDSAAGTSLAPSPGGWLAGVATPLALDDGTAGGIPIASSDAFTPQAGATAELTYGAGAEAAAVRKGKSLVLGVALDSLVGEQARAAVLGAWATQAVTPVVIEPTPDGGVVVADGGAGAPDAAQVAPDASAPGEDAAVATPDAGTAALDATLPPDAAVGGVDATTLAPDADPTGGLWVATSDDPIRGGCGCSTGAVRTTRGDALGGLGLMLALSLLRRSRRRHE